MSFQLNIKRNAQITTRPMGFDKAMREGLPIPLETPSVKPMPLWLAITIGSALGLAIAFVGTIGLALIVTL